MISGTFNFMIVFQAEHKNIVLIKLGELLGKFIDFVCIKNEKKSVEL
jgi:hypothetical protein